jgi:decaprenylphospho-beta-D-ribofuranose 2-oxidase
VKFRKVPMDAPNFALGPIVRAFNGAYFRRVPATGRTVVKPISTSSSRSTRSTTGTAFTASVASTSSSVSCPSLPRRPCARCQAIAASGLASPLAVLKRMGPGRAGYLSFPMKVTPSPSISPTGLRRVT